MTKPTPLIQSKRGKAQRALLAAIPAAAMTLTGAVAMASSVYPEDAMQKVQPEAAEKAPGTAKISAARNEYESFQVVVKADAGGLTGVTATASELTGPGGARIPATNVTLYREELMNISQKSGGIGATGRFPDALVPATDDLDGQQRNGFPMDVPANEARAIWVDVLVPKDAAPGTYTGSVTVTGSNGLSQVTPVELEVWDFELPSTPSLRTAFLLNAGNVCQAHTGRSDCGDPATASALIGKYERMALDNRISLPNIWVVKPSGGDWSQFDAAFGPLLDGTAQTHLPGAKMTSAQYSWGDRSYATMKDFADHFRSKGWFDRVYDYVADEPPYGSPWGQIQSRTDFIKSVDPEFRSLVTTNIDEADKNGATKYIDDLVPIVNHMESTQAPYQGDQRSKYDAYVATPGKRLWMYQSCMSQGCSFGGSEAGANWPSYMIDVSATKNRVMQWADFKEGVQGELYYETALVFDRDPWSSQMEFGGNGDGTLFYPGKPAKIGGTSDIPVASVRVKMIREGVEDFEYLTMVSQLGDPAFAKQMALQVMPTAYAASDDPTALIAARRALAQRILELSGKNGGGGTTDPSSIPVPGASTGGGTSAPAPAESAPSDSGSGSGSTTLPWMNSSTESSEGTSSDWSSYLPWLS